MLVQHWALDRWHCIASDYLLGCIVVSTITDISLSTDDYEEIRATIESALYLISPGDTADGLSRALALLEEGEVL